MWVDTVDLRCFTLSLTFSYWWRSAILNRINFVCFWSYYRINFLLSLAIRPIWSINSLSLYTASLVNLRNIFNVSLSIRLKREFDNSWWWTVCHWIILSKARHNFAFYQRVDSLSTLFNYFCWGSCTSVWIHWYYRRVISTPDLG